MSHTSGRSFSTILRRGLDGRHEALLLELRVDEGLEELERHAVRQPALMQPQLRTDHDHRATGVVDALAEQVLAEAARLALQHVGEALQRALRRTRDDAAAAAVVEERVDRFLQHPLLVADDDLGRVQLLEALQAVVAVDHPAIQIVEIRGREATAIERHERPQIRRDHRHDLEHHVLRPVHRRLAERVEHLEALGDLLALGLAGRLPHLLAQARALALDVELGEQSSHGLGADADLERVAAVGLAQLLQALVGDELALLELGVLRIEHDVRLEVEHLLEITQRDLEDVADAATAATSGTRCGRPATPG